MFSGYGNGPNDIFNYGPYFWGNWDYGLIRDLNLALDGIDQNSTSLTQTQKDQFKAEFRFLRAFVYFELVKRHGGVPIVTTQLLYDFSGNPSPLQVARSKEAEVYDFVASELDAIKGTLGNTGSNTRANRYTAMALKSRAMLYAASIAKYTPISTLPLSTPGGEVGIPANLATAYYQKALDAAKEVLTGPYALYNSNPNKGENFYEALVNKNGNSEVIWVKDFLTSKDYRHFFSVDNIPRGLREDFDYSSNITPTLNFVETYENLNGTTTPIPTMNAAGTDYVYYNTLSEPFANKDARLYGTVILPGSTFKSREVQVQAGVKVWSTTSNSYQNVEGNLGSVYTDGKLLTGSSGPLSNQPYVTNSGFYLRKYLDTGAGTSTRATRSDVWWVRFRLAEILLTASEAALELGQTADALTYVNRVR
ncbi:MAG: RagB/SusD family nutrient uptake outer membrane protein, partial [Hymenobacter sp.]